MSNTTDTAKLLLGGVSIESPRYRHALLFSLWDGIFANAMVALVETFGIAAAVFLDAPAIAIALLGSLPLFISSFGQLLIPLFINPASGRKKYVLRGTTWQSIFLLLVACSGYLPEEVRAWAYVLLFALYGFAGNVVSGFWIAWMGDLVPHTVRGRHFAWRNRIFSITQLLCALTAGLISRRYTTTTAQWLLFAIVFFGAGVFRMLSAVMLHKQYEPPVTASPNGRCFKSIFKQPRPFLFYCIAAALVQGSTSIAGPFFNVWFIRDLHFNYFMLSAVAAATILGSIAALPFWGGIADSFGNRTVIIITVLLIATVPLPYIASNKPWQIWVLNFYTGCCWSGYNLSNLNYLLLAAGKENPEQNISFAVAVTGIFNFVFSIAGGYLATRLPHFFHYQLHSLFLLSSMMRFLVFGLLIIRYPRYETPKRHALDLFFQIPGYRGGLGLLRNSFRAFRAK
ncbi:MAG: MFS transporter [Chitinispirillaceae bacterium]|nr:MFS transporter [Chitinispirillaceae bacterium]